MPSLRSARRASLAALAFALLLTPDARAYINQTDGTVVPLTNRMQMCLDLHEASPGDVDAVADAAVLPEAYRPVRNGMGNFEVVFTDIGEGAGFRNSFGWFWLDEDPSDPANLHTVFGCRTYGTCDCPCGTTRTVTVDFGARGDFVEGRAIGLWLRTPERLDASRENGTFDSSGCDFNVGCDPTTPNLNDSCGGRLDTNNRIYFTSSALNDDGDFVHFLVYESLIPNTYYFGFEDLFRGGDNDYEDMLIQSTGLVPLCTPRAETCDGTDEDCDMAIDEGITTACSTTCGDGVRTCTAGSFGACSAPTPTGETCDGTDEDCDGRTDEGLSRACSNSCGSGTEICIAGSFADCSAPTPGIETCNGDDDDCDGTTDEMLTRACTSMCGSGVETCTAGSFGGCTAPVPGAETCDGTDQDCDGRTDEGLTMPCSTACGAGIATCIAGSFVGCSAPTPTTETCDGTDEDCDGMTDEGITRACSNACGVGTETCVDGAFVGCDVPEPQPEVCNNLDDDCNGIIDDGNPGGGEMCIPTEDGGFILEPEPSGDERCTPGRVACVAGELVCSGATSPTREVCNCMDDDCDGEIDEDPDGTFCPGGACLDCRCLTPCRDDEFPCPPGRICDPTHADPDAGIPGYCVGGSCEGVECADTETCDPATGECRDLCEGISCGPSSACVRGRCVEDNCYGRGCASGERCVDGTCEADPCAGVGCEDGAFCRDGECVAVCDLSCPEGERCEAGACVAAPCEGRCASGESCVDGACVTNTCSPACGRDRVCRGDVCEHDPCANVRCPGETVCRSDDGQCVDGSVTPPTETRYGVGGGGGGCTCAVTSTPGSVPGPWMLLLGVLLLGVRRRAAGTTGTGASGTNPGTGLAGRGRGRGTGTGTGLVALAALVLLAGCEVDPFCFENCGDEVDAGPADTGRPDARPMDGCVATGEESCNELDDDCDGLVDEGFDLQTDPRHCGGCGSECVLPGAFPGCAEGDCTVEECEVGFFDLDGNPTNGCEYACPPTGPEICDETDNDCDGAIDEGFDLDTDLGHCGACGNACIFANATASCTDGSCVREDCNAGFVDLDGDPDNGCEYRCGGAGGEETCNAIDDDCDGTVDEGFDLSADVTNCGVCGRTCDFLNADPLCADGVCQRGTCRAGFVDLDGDPNTGCEYACTPTGSADTCDGVDDDCDGAFDEADATVGTPCGSATGECERGVNSCQRGAITCVGGAGATAETCNALDDDCDGRTDESPVPGEGDRCGATNVGRCRFGTLSCSGGALSCGGAFRGPVAETCNGVDDDCNGATDDGLTPPAPGSVPSCAMMSGVCAGRMPTCRGAAGWACDPPAAFQATESICDGDDNDCDGSTDEGCLSPVGTDRRLDTHVGASAENSVQPAVTGDGSSRVYAAWMEVSDRAHVYFARSTDNGGSFGAPVRLDSAGGAAIGPELASSGTDDVVGVWADFRGGTNYREIYSRFSTNRGGTFAGNVKVNAAGETATRDSFGVDIAASGNNVYVVYEAFQTNRRRQVYFSRSTDNGASWSTPVQLSTPMGTTFVAATPRVAASGNRVYVVWRDNRSGALDVYMRRSTNGGSTFQPEQRVDVGDAAGSSVSTSPDVAAEGDNVYFVWVDDRDGGSLDIWMNRSIDAGATLLGAAVKLDQDPVFPHDSIQPRVVATSAGGAVAAWVDYRSGFADVLAVRTDDAFMSFSEPARLDTGTSPGASESLDLELAASGAMVAAAWSDDRSGALDVYANVSLDGGENWQPSDYRMDTDTLGVADSQDPHVYVGNGRVHVIWVDHRAGGSCPSPMMMSCPNGDIFHRRLQ